MLLSQSDSRTGRGILLLALLLAGPAVASHETPVPESIASIVHVCESCHGQQGVSQNSSIPSLAGQHEVFLLNRLTQFKYQNSPSELMRAIVATVDKETLQKLAHYYANLPYIRPRQGSIDEKAQRGVDVYQKLCHICHRDEGKSSTYAEYPLLAGQSLEYMQESIRSILAGDRKVDQLKRELLNLASPQQIEDAVHFFASQVVQPGDMIRRTEKKKKSRQRSLTTFP